MNTMSDGEYAVMHDLVMETFGVEPVDTQVERFWCFMPKDLKKEIAHWGINDSLTKDNIYEWLLSVKDDRSKLETNEAGI